MLELKLGRDLHIARSFLFLGAHCDDIEIGCGGVVSRLSQEHPEADFRWVVFSSNAQRASETRHSFDLFFREVTNKSLIVKNFRNGYFPYDGAKIKDYFEELKELVSPDVVFTHFSRDLHQDHRILSELTSNTFRDHLIFEYEIPKYDGGLGSPNVFFPLKESDYNKKLDILTTCFSSEHRKHWFAKETFLGLMRLRGIECNAPSGYAEAFYCRKAAI